MKNILILGANGQIAEHAIDLLLKQKENQLTLFVREAKNPTKAHATRGRVIEGDVMNYNELKSAMAEQDGARK